MASVNLNQGGGCTLIDQSHDVRGFSNERLKPVAVYATYFNKTRGMLHTQYFTTEEMERQEINERKVVFKKLRSDPFKLCTMSSIRLEPCSSSFNKKINPLCEVCP
jgi:hypothetical protein